MRADGGDQPALGAAGDRRLGQDGDTGARAHDRYSHDSTRMRSRTTYFAFRDRRIWPPRAFNKSMDEDESKARRDCPACGAKQAVVAEVRAMAKICAGASPDALSPLRKMWAGSGRRGMRVSPRALVFGAGIAVGPRQPRRIGAEEMRQAATATSAASCARGRVCRQRRPEVVTRARRQSGRLHALEPRRQAHVLHQRDGRKAADLVEGGAGDEHGLVAGGDAGRGASAGSSWRRPAATSRLPSKRTSKRPQARPERASPSSTSASASSGRRVSACRNSSTSPRAAAAPAFICEARPRGAVSTWSASGAASAAVSSLLPPSTTITSAPRAR